MMYFVEKVRLKRLGDDEKLAYPKHKLIGHFYTLEDTLKAVKDCATTYMTKKNLKFTDQTESDHASRASFEQKKHPKIITRYTMRSNHANKNIIDIYKEQDECKEGWGWGSASIKRTEEKFAYFVYTTYKTGNLNFEQTKEEEPSIPIPPPNPTVVTNRVKNRLNNLGKEMDMLENHGKLVDELRQSSKYHKNNTISAVEIIDQELKELGKYIL